MTSLNVARRFDGVFDDEASVLRFVVGRTAVQIQSNPEIPYFIEYNAHMSIAHNCISQQFWAKNYLYFSRIISQELIIATLFIIKAILNPFSATFHV
jgi:hypothetical protein